jgi:hypothetical protein
VTVAFFSLSAVLVDVTPVLLVSFLAAERIPDNIDWDLAGGKFCDSPTC